MEYFEKTINIDEPVENIYSVIANINHYPDFLPYCISTTIMSIDNNIITARINFDFYRMKISICTKNKNTKNESIQMKLIDGPFSKFNALWLFSETTSSSTQIKYSMEYTVLNPLIALLIKKNINTFIEKFIEAFRRQIKSQRN